MKKLLGLFALLFIGVPALAYTVKPGDTLWKLYGTKWQQVAAQNGIINPKNLKVGQIINDKLGGQLLGNTNFVQSQFYTLSGSGVASGATTVVLKKFQRIDGTNLTMADFGTKGWGTIEPNNGTQEEQISFTGVTQNANGTATITGVSDVLTVYPYTEASGVTITHPGGVKFVISNTAGFYNTFTNKTNTGTISGLWTFSAIPFYTDTILTSTFSSSTQIIDKAYADSLTFAGAPNGSFTAKGIFQAATDTQLQAGTFGGSTGANLVPTGLAFNQTSTPNKIPISNGSGVLDPNWINTSSAYTWSGNHTFNGLITVNGTSTLATTTIVTSTITQLNLPGVNVNRYVSCAIQGVTTTFSKADTTSSTLISVTIPGGCVGVSSTLKAHIHFSNVGITNTQWLNLHFQYGTQINDFSVTNQAGSSFYGDGYVNYSLIATTTAQQLMTSEINFASSTSGGLTGITTLSPQMIFGGWSKAMSVDTTQNQTLNISVSNSTNAATTIYTVDYVTVEIIR